MVACLAKAALITPAYLSIAWALMVSYQIFTETAVKTLVDSFVLYVPLLGNWLNLRIDMVVFIYAFAWVFVLSSLIPSLILGRDRGVFVQFLVCLILTLTAFVLIDVIARYGLDFTNPAVIMSNPYMGLFGNIVFAAFYLSLPYIFMVAIDLQLRKRRKQQDEKAKELTHEFNSRKSNPVNPVAQRSSATV
jgi:uncharacterized membrane protein